MKKEIKEEPVTQTSPKKRGKKEEEEQEVWKWFVNFIDIEKFLYFRFFRFLKGKLI